MFLFKLKKFIASSGRMAEGMNTNVEDQKAGPLWTELETQHLLQISF